jgi:hypothetical protein
MSFRLIFWFVALVASLIAANREYTSLFHTGFSYLGSAFSKPVGNEPATAYLSVQVSGIDDREYTFETTVDRAKWFMDIFSYGVTGLFATLHLVLFYILWLIAFKKRPKHEREEPAM